LQNSLLWGRMCIMSKTSMKNDSNLHTYKDKTHLTRFLIVYKFSLKQSIRLLWHKKITSHFFTSETVQKKEKILYSNLGKDCKKLFIRLGGVYIKVGQFLSNLAHILPEYFIENLRDLQDRIPPHSFEEIRIRFEKEIGKNIYEVFQEIEEIPIASASTAQVHSAIYKERKVAIKVLYPHIEDVIEKDLKTLLFVMKRINRYLYSFDFKSIHKEIEKIVKREMDLSKESESIRKMDELFYDEPEIMVPRVEREISARGVLVTDFVEGVKITETEHVLGKAQPKSKPLELLLRAYILMIFRYKFFHADPHPGNVLFTPDGKLCLLDFGAVGEIPESLRISLRKTVISAMSKDYYGVVEGMEEMGFFSKHADKEKLEELARYSFQKLERFLSDTDLFKNIPFEKLGIMDSYDFLRGINSSLKEILKFSQIPENFVALQRVMALLAGNIASIDPYRTFFDYADRPFRLVVLGGSSVERILKEEGRDIVGNALSIPGELHRALLNLNRGRWNFRLKDMDRHTHAIVYSSRQLVNTILAVSSVHFGNYFADKSLQNLSVFCYVMGSVFGVVLLVSLIKGSVNK